MKKGAIVHTGKKKVIENRIPNDWPFKEDLLKEIQVAKEKLEDNKARHKEKRKEEIVSKFKINFIAVYCDDIHFYLLICFNLAKTSSGPQ